MRVRLLNLDGLARQETLVRETAAEVVPLETWGPRIRLACSLPRFRRFARAVAVPGDENPDEPILHYYGSGDFHHVTLALLRGLRTPFNLLILDNHPDWMRAIPFMHCGTWVRHALGLPNLARIFHVGGDVDFDNGFRWLAPRREILSGKITVIPSVRRYQAGFWSALEHRPLRLERDVPATPENVRLALEPWAGELAGRPLYISLDKDVMVSADAPVNWDSGHLTLGEVEEILRTALGLANGRLAGMDILGDWSPVRTQGLLRAFLHQTEHPSLAMDEAAAHRRNEQVNLGLFRRVGEWVEDAACHRRAAG